MACHNAGFDEFHVLRPRATLFLEYVYELDLDNLIFFINRHPFFRLNGVPSNSIFMADNGSNSDHTLAEYGTIEMKRWFPGGLDVNTTGQLIFTSIDRQECDFYVCKVETKAPQ